MAFTYKIASEAWEFEQIHRLNHDTFAGEIPQHAANGSGRLIDRFHEQNTYFICLDECRLVGMVALRDQRPFSLDAKLPALDSYLNGARALCEIRLLVVHREKRGTRVFRELAGQLARHLLEHGYDLALISGTLRQQKLYRHIGFEPFGPQVGTVNARYQPMYLKRDALWDIASRHGIAPVAPIYLLPGPLPLSPAVAHAMARPPLSHRSVEFDNLFRDVQQRLSQLTQALHSAILLGSGTLANDVVAGQLTRETGRGLILSNGEFGERLIDHARRFGLDFDSLSLGWGTHFEMDEVRSVLDASGDIAWLWAVHCETSTGALNDIDELKVICAERDMRLCLDCISSLGVVPVDLRGVYLATGVSGKGLRSASGLAMVFHHQAVNEQAKIPRYLDLALYATGSGVPFTHSSYLLAALQTALCERRDTLRETAELWAWLRGELEALGLELVTPLRSASPAILTFALPANRNSLAIGDELARNGYLLSYQSDYLATRNWMQICLMGENRSARLQHLLDRLRNVMEEEPQLS